MGPEDCAGWEYNTHPNYHRVAEACAVFLDELRANPASKVAALSDTRPFHQSVFSQVAPQACPCMAGNYRGSDFDCLRGYGVQFDGHHGTIPVAVLASMDFYHQDALDALHDLDQAAARHVNPLKGGKFLVRLVQIVARLLVRFFTIHPYANGNGHMGRLVVWVILGKYNRLPVKWWLHESPPRYGPLMTDYRNGKTKPLETYLMGCILG